MVPINLEKQYEDCFAAITRQQVADNGRADWPLASQLAIQQVFEQLVAQRRYKIASKFLGLHDSPGAWQPRPPARGTHDLTCELAESLQREDRDADAKALWKRIIGARRPYFIQAVKTFQSLKNPTDGLLRDAQKLIQDTKSCLLAALAEYMRCLQRSGTAKEIAVLKRETDDVEAEQTPSRTSREDSRKIDQDVFWGLIEERGKKTDNVDEHLQNLAAALEGFKPSEIISFQKILNKRLQEVNKQELWAVATIMMGGSCADDDFLYFCCHLVLRGRKAFEALSRNAEKAADDIHPGDPVTAEGLLYVASEAHQSVTGKDLPASAAYKPKSLKKLPWKEADLIHLYPKLCKRFEFKPR